MNSEPRRMPTVRNSRNRRSNAPITWWRLIAILLVIQSLVLKVTIRYEMEPTGGKIEIHLVGMLEIDHGQSWLMDKLHIPH